MRSRLRAAVATVCGALICAGVLHAQISHAVASPVDADGFRVPLYATQPVNLGICTEPGDLDCIESIRVLRDGEEMVPQHAQSEDDEEYWTYPGIDGEEIPFDFGVSVVPLGYVHDDPLKPRRASLLVNIARRADADHPYRGVRQLECDTGRVEDCVAFDPPLPAGDRFEVVVRTSWLRPLQVSTHGEEMQTTWTALGDGYRFRFSARQMLMPLVDPLTTTQIPPSWERAKGWDAQLYFVVDHAATRKGWSAYDTRCADKGFPNTALNAPIAGRPDWHPGDSAFSMNVLAPHYAPDGSQLTGNFEAEIPLAWLRCRSGQPKLRPNLLEVRVVSENGEEQAATTSLQSRRGMLYVRAYDFHYSAPRIEIALSKDGRR